MSIDKFGRPQKRSLPPPPLKGPPGKGFKLTLDGNYDMDNKRLTNLNEPRQNNDAATKTYCDKKVFPTLGENGWDMKNKKLTSVDLPTNDSDAVNLLHLRRYTPGWDEDAVSWDMKKARISNVDGPFKETDAATKRYCDKKIKSLPPGEGFKLTPDGNNYDMDNKRLTSIKDPNQANDAVTKRYCDGRIQDLANDVKHYVDRKSPMFYIVPMFHNHHSTIKDGV